MSATIVEAGDVVALAKALASGKRKAAKAGRRPVDDETRMAIEDMARAGGHSRNAIAREFDVAPSTVSSICAKASPPITFDRSATAAAVEAHSVDLKAERVDMGTELLNDARRIQRRIFTSRDVWDAKAEVMVSVERDGREVQALATAVGILLDKHLLLLRTDSDDRDLPAVEVFVRGMGVPRIEVAS